MHVARRMRRFSRDGDAPERIEFVLGRASDARFAPKAPPMTQREWARAVGPRIADRTKPVSLERGVLLVQAATSTWATELSMLRDPILMRLRAIGLDVKDVRFRVRPIAPPPRPPERRGARVVPPPAELPESVRRSIAKLDDPELAAIIAEAAGKNLAWQDNTSAARPATSGPRAARAPRAAETKSAPPDRSSARARASRRRNPEDE